MTKKFIYTLSYSFLFLPVPKASKPLPTNWKLAGTLCLIIITICTRRRKVRFRPAKATTISPTGNLLLFILGTQKELSYMAWL